MEKFPSYQRLFLILLAGIALVVVGGLLKRQNVGGSGLFALVGLAIQAVAMIMMVYKYAKGLKS
ncbi:hypothetical protein [Hymenobacter cavernae]|uniref:Gliding motility protein GldL n=1 Tax=Hymenobacter cavernae TaxID=2044852 RepID=A0ABQ1UKJ5_9BACT|nr:hypothetical protein [Hymenobacter cavernae]GGF19141.1 hypothetical protein GCM10011383_33320 [Hymenobacter cavernae]